MKVDKITCPVFLLDDLNNKSAKYVNLYEKSYPKEAKFKYRFVLKISKFDGAGRVVLSGVDRKYQSLDGKFVTDDTNTCIFSTVEKRFDDKTAYVAFVKEILKSVNVRKMTLTIPDVIKIFELLKQ